jgi:RNA polymerase sigma-70 factor, ECF subfamily
VTDRALTEESSHDVHAAPATEERPLPFALDEAFRAHGGFVANSLRRFGVRPADLKDQLQEVFLVVFRSGHTFDVTRPLRPWLFGIAYRVAARYREGHGRIAAAEDIDDVVVVDPQPLADRALQTKEAQALVLAALERVELSRRAVLILADIEGEPVPTIAEALGIPLNTAYSRLRLAREELTRAVRRSSTRQGGRS